MNLNSLALARLESLSFQRQRGMALLMMLMLLALATIVVTGILLRQQEMRDAAQILLRQQQGWAYALGEEAVLIDTLRQASRANPTVTSLQQPWAQPQRFQLEGGTGDEINGQLSDRSSCFNVNVVVGKSINPNDESQAYFKRLLNQAGVDAATILLIETQLSQQTTSLRNLSTLSQVQGIDSNTLRNINDVICTLPQLSKINVNTAAAPVLAALDVSITPAAASAWVAQRTSEPPLQQVSQLWSKPGFTNVPPARRSQLEPLLDVKSRFFQARIHVTVDGRVRHLTSQLYQDGGQITVYQRSQASPQVEQLTSLLTASRVQ